MDSNEKESHSDTNEQLEPDVQMANTVPMPPTDEGMVDDEAAVDSKLEQPIDEPPAQSLETQPLSKPQPTIADLDKSHEADLDAPGDKSVAKEDKTITADPNKRKNTAALAIIVALLVALLLVGIGYAAYRASRGSSAEQNPDETNQQTADETLNTSDSDQLDQDIEQIDGDLKQLEDELDSNNPTDDNLGL